MGCLGEFQEYTIFRRHEYLPGDDEGPKLPYCRQIYFGYHRSMNERPDIALLGFLIGDPARANMLTALMGGKALTASELAGAAGVTA